MDESASQFAKTVIIMTIFVGVAFIAAYLILGRVRSYLMYLGLAFISLSITLMTSGLLRVVFVVAALATFIYAVIDGIQDSRERVRKFREEQQDREAAFAEFMEAVAHKEVEQTPLAENPSAAASEEGQPQPRRIYTLGDATTSGEQQTEELL